MATLNPQKKAPVYDQDGAVLTSVKHTVTTSNAAAVSVAPDTGGRWYATNANATGTPATATLTATRLFDGAVATLDVTAAALVPFSITLGAEVAA